MYLSILLCIYLSYYLPIYLIIYLSILLYIYLSYLSSYVGKDEEGIADWTGCRNVKLRRLETAHQFGHYIEVSNPILR